MSALFYLIALSSIGLLISLYAFYVKIRMKKDKSYSAACDINEKISCTKAMGSKYGSFFIVPNSVWGIGFYALLLALSWMQVFQAVFWLSVIAVLGSVYLAYVSFFKIRILCPLCLGIYAVNIGLLAIGYSGI